MIVGWHTLIKRGEWKRWKRILTVVYLLAGMATLYNYLEWRSAAFAAGVIVLALTPSFEKHPPGNLRYGWGALILLVLYFFIPVKTIFYLALAAAVLFFREGFYRKAAPSVPLVILLMSPVTDYAVQLFSFPIRLRLTELAGRMIRSAGRPVQVAGNILTYQGREFAVDPACMGLHMLVISLLAGLLLLNYQQARYRRQVGVVTILTLTVIILALNILANLFRIVCLVLFSIGPDSPMHGIMGILCLAAYVILPLFPLTREIVRRWGRPAASGGGSRTGAGSQNGADGPAGGRSRWRRSRLLLTGNWLIAGCVAAAAIVCVTKPDNPANMRIMGPGLPVVPGYTAAWVNGSILQLNNDRSLVYIKPIPDFYYTDHSPMICWQGSGYVFGKLQERTVSGVRIYQGVLVHGQQVLYTAWWYDNGGHRTTEQMDWRWDVLRGGRKYSIVNITAASQSTLEEEVHRVLATNPFREVLEH